MLDDELEGEFILGWPDRKRLSHMTSTDAEGRVVYARSPVLEQEGLITPVDAFFINAQVQMPEAMHPDDWSVEICGEVNEPFSLTLKELMNFPARTVRAVTECAGNDGDYFDYTEQKTNEKPQMIRGGTDIDGFVKKYKDGKQNVKYRSGRNDQHTFSDMLMGKRHRNVLWGNFDIRFFSHHFDITAERDR